MISENKIEMKFHIFSDVSENCKETKSEYGEILFEIEEQKNSSLFSLFNYIEEYKQNKSGSKFFCIDNRKLETNESGLKKIHNILIEEYDHVKYSISTNLKHKTVNRLIEELSNYDPKNPKNQNPFLYLSHLKEKLIKFSEEKVIGNDEFELERKECVNPESYIENILLDLHQLGVIIYFKDDTLKDIIITNPSWFNDVIILLFLFFILLILIIK